MKKFAFTVEICLGYHCCGSPEYEEGEGTVELEDSQVDQLVALIREHGGETDPEEIGLEESYPDIYGALEEAYSDAARKAEYRHWVISGYENGYLEEPEDLMESLEKAGLFQYSPDSGEDEEAREEAFSEWLDNYLDSLSEVELVSFLETYYSDSLEDIETGLAEYEVGIPKGIIELADGGNA